jgi:hypothetical protein
MRQTPHLIARRLLSLTLVAGLAVATSGCAYTMGEFDQKAAANAPASTDNAATSALPMKPATYVVDTTDMPSHAASTGLPAPAPNSAAEAYPNMNQVPQGPKSTLLSPAEKAKVIADLEALAKSQEAAVETSRKRAVAQCGDAVKNTLDPEAKLKSEAAGQGC